MKTSILVVAAILGTTHGCTDFVLRDALPKNLAISARNMDFHLDMNTDVVKVNRGIARQSLPIYECPDCTPTSWDVKYGYVFSDLMKQDVVSDGLNEAGLSAAILVLSHYSRFPHYNVTDSRPLMGGQSLPEYILGTCADVACAREAVDKFHIVAAQHPMMDLMGGDIPCHFSIMDKEGNHLVIEPVFNKTASPDCLGPDHDESNSKMCVYDNNEYKVLTNHPPLEEQIANIKAKEAAAGDDWQNYWSTMPGWYFQQPRFERAVFFNRLSLEKGGTWMQKVPQIEKLYQTTVMLAPPGEWTETMRTALTAGAEAGSDGVSDLDAFLKSFASQVGASDEQLAYISQTLSGLSTSMGTTVGEYLHIFAEMDDHIMSHFLSQNQTFSNPDPAFDAVARAQYIIQANTMVPGSSSQLGSSPVTCWTVIRDHTNLRYYVRTPGNTGLIYYDISKMDFSNGAGRVSNAVNWEYAYPDVTHLLDASVAPSTTQASGNCASGGSYATLSSTSESGSSDSSGVPVWSLILTGIIGLAVGGAGAFVVVKKQNRDRRQAESTTDLSE
ncbi:hypothetical protein SARC_01906 [Sphaeroforma arctica JP610]|uniref:Choloylglycine hydrolase/NAAA C-terminal domain-containing protein n=1 Tax=Sphaeroforma arctica JP610 TaxID=667725 RepID=A0A0L0GCC5_9EUKA|nr:hypothetical protein SARC_01906 [Sphaeroforma arctica JP610]KNC85913.1 hypothetical protein SARC_01906 [Sphaeroforma arctica JP610]|eukprot:XP_014159815.1 hypothetical protein SARC_01906 [Sphaeroforma arctica JP610]